MTVQFQANDREFVTSTGARATPDARTTRFDGAPEASSNLVVSTKTGDLDPRVFEVGDTYDLVWEGGRIDGAEVVRSDAAGDGGIVGFSGVDQNGNAALVLWTPGFDLQSWYDGVRGRASFYTSDQQASYTHEFVCFAAEARIATPYGPMPVGGLKPGHRVLTRDRGPQVIRWVGHRRVQGQGDAAPVLIETGVLGAIAPLRLSPQHRVMIASPHVEMMFGVPEVFVPAKALVGATGVTLEPCALVTYVHLLLDDHHVIDAEGVACESLFLGPVASETCVQFDAGNPVLEGCAIDHDHAARPILTYQEARVLLGLGMERPRVSCV